MKQPNLAQPNNCATGTSSPCILADGRLVAYLDLLEGLRGLGGRCLDGPGSSTTGVCDVERREDLEGRGIVFVLINLKRGRGRTSVSTLSGG